MTQSRAIASIIIPIAPNHVHVAANAIQSAMQQTVPCEVIPIADEQQLGAGWARNRGIEKATAEFVVFLDADDQLMPNFVERAWALHQQTGRYVYTDFVNQNGRLYAAPECAWVNDAWHAVTALIPTAWVREVDGFDEDLRLGGEDSEFYVHLCSEGHCGTRLPEALFVYTNAPDSRSKRWHNLPERQVYNAMIEERYVSKGKTAMACCTEPATPMGQPETAAPSKVLARPKWGGNRRERGAVTGVFYPPADRSQVIEIDPRDAAARPDHWDVIVVPPPARAIPAPVAVIEPTPALQDLARRALNVKPPPYQPPPPPPPAEIVPTVPDVAKVTRLASRLAPPPRSNDGGWYTESPGVEYAVPVMPSPPPYAPPQMTSIPTLEAPRQSIASKPSWSANVQKRTGDPVFVFPDVDYPSYTDVKRLVELSGFEAARFSESSSNDGRVYIHLSPEQPPQISHEDFSRQIWWSLEYGGEYEPDVSNWRRGAGDEIWASDPAWAKAHGAKLVIMGSHPDLKSRFGQITAVKEYDYLTLAYQTPRRMIIERQLSDLKTPKNPYPGHDAERNYQLIASQLLLHVHQRDDTRAIAPQRIALAAAYKLPLICESVPDAGEYERYLPFVAYENLNGEVRSQLAMYADGIPQARGERLHQWLCQEHTFRASVEQALKS